MEIEKAKHFRSLKLHKRQKSMSNSKRSSSKRLDEPQFGYGLQDCNNTFQEIRQNSSILSDRKSAKSKRSSRSKKSSRRSLAKAKKVSYKRIKGRNSGLVSHSSAPKRVSIRNSRYGSNTRRLSTKRSSQNALNFTLSRPRTPINKNICSNCSKAYSQKSLSPKRSIRRIKKIKKSSTKENKTPSKKSISAQRKSVGKHKKSARKLRKSLNSDVFSQVDSNAVFSPSHIRRTPSKNLSKRKISRSQSRSNRLSTRFWKD